ncbi:MAG: hypothetical protein IEMM0002_1324 [bacterium]|nr:MAG: hypothetical protein IEMM0002_1324 [bacterium]
MERTRDHVIDIIRDLPFFDAFETDEIKKFARNLSLQQVKKGEVLFNEGDVGDYLFFIVEGIIEIVLSTVDKQHKIIATYSSGTSVGEMSLIDEFERSATVQASTDCEILILTRSKFDWITSNQPEIGVKMLRGLAKIISERLRGTQGRFKDMV